MPEIGEIARLVHFIRKHLVGRTIAKCRAYPDDIVYGKVGCSADAFERAVTGRRVIGADQQGKYFYMLFDRPPHAVMHCGMTGWLKVDVEDTTYYPNAKEKKADQGWPPKYVKFLLSCAPETVNGVERGAVEAAFVDPRRLARIRLVHCEADRIRQETPLKENGPDPVRDRHLVTVEWLEKLLGRKHVPVKALLLDQANLSGVGNWVADEVLYQARIHPEQYTDTMFTSQIQQLHDSLINVCTTAVDTLADSTKFPENWIMKYRWDKGKKDANVLPNGEKIVHIKVGGRTSAIVPTVQRK
ncbi:S13-like H2TH domain-containing protein, partial [Piedraia hortae CBS 480.64]